MKNDTTYRAMDIVNLSEQAKALNKDRTSWKLEEWNAHFSGGKPSMTSVEIAGACMWLVEKGYPKPEDCPKRPEEKPFDGGCPAFRPACLMFKDCRAARGMCDTIGMTARCSICHEIFNIEELRDKLSLKEYQISGLCQSCQDKTFGRE